MPKNPSPDPDSAEPSFEEAMSRLDEIVASMEKERLPLDEMVSSYEEGARLLKLCRQRIETARQRVERIHSLLDAESEPSLEPFDPAAESDEAPARPTRAAKKSPSSADADDDIRLF